MVKKIPKPQAELLFEVSWEVCNKVGGIFTVLSSKAQQVKKYYKDGYFLVGPYFENASRSTFRADEVPEKYRAAFEEMKNLGVICHFGQWLVEGDPNVILLDFKGYLSHTHEIKQEFWDLYGIDSLQSGWDFDEPLVWSYAVGILMEKLRAAQAGKKMVVQAHEWLAGGTVLYLHKNPHPIPTVFTTHATVLGRTLAGAGVDLYRELQNIEPDSAAWHQGVPAKHLLEKASAQKASVFTTVSDTTKLEAESFLGRKVDIVLPNGLDMSQFPSFEEISHKHNLYRNRLREFCLYYFAPYYFVNMQESLFFFTACRYEFHNKGIDVLIEALGQLNAYMKKVKHRKTVVVFFFVPAGTQNIRPEIVEAREAFKDIKDLLEEEKRVIEENLLYTLMDERPVNAKNLLSESFSGKMERRILRIKNQRGDRAPLCTHLLSDENGDAILNGLRAAGLENKPDDAVKAIFYPIYLDGADGLGNLDYYESIQASHLGIFPSYYEPWGYTPLEAAAWGVSAITSNLSGFGKYFEPTLKGARSGGVGILNMEGREQTEIVRDLTKMMTRYVNHDRAERIESKIKARKIAAMADWEIFNQNYIEAHNLALNQK